MILPRGIRGRAECRASLVPQWQRVDFVSHQVPPRGVAQGIGNGRAASYDAATSMRSFLDALGLIVLVALAPGRAEPDAASDTTTRIVTAHAQLVSRTTLTVSTQLLEFAIARPGEPATATVDFVAGVRTHAGAEVLLTVEPVGAIDADSRITISGSGDAAAHGALVTSGPSIAGRWVGSGRRSGRLAFALHTNVTGTYRIPLRFVLSAP